MLNVRMVSPKMITQNDWKHDSKCIGRKNVKMALNDDREYSVNMVVGQTTLFLSLYTFRYFFLLLNECGRNCFQCPNGLPKNDRMDSKCNCRKNGSKWWPRMYLDSKNVLNGLKQSMSKMSLPKKVETCVNAAMKCRLVNVKNVTVKWFLPLTWRVGQWSPSLGLWWSC